VSASGTALGYALVVAVAPVVGGVASPDPSAVVAIRARAACGQPPLVFCTGTLVAPRAVLTAAHCIRDTPLGVLEVVALADARDAGAPAVALAGGFVAPAATGGAAPDLAVLALVEPLAGPLLAPGALPEPAAGTIVTLVGYGDDGTGGVGVRLAGTATIMSADAQEILVVPGPSLACGGDSGGPVLLGDSIVGVISFGDPGCAMTTTSVRVENHLAFIDAAVTMAAGLPGGVPAPGEPDCGIGDGDGWCRASPGRRGTPRGALPLALVLVLVALAGAGCRTRSSGVCLGGRQHGFGPPKDRLMYCTDEQGKKHGVFREWWPTDTLKIEAMYEHGVQHGRFVRYHQATGQKELEGEYVQGLKKGRWVERYDDGTVKRVSEYLDDTEVRWTLYYEDGGEKWIEGRHKHHRENGRFVEYAPNGQVIAEGDFVDGAKAGNWVYRNDDGTPTTEERGAYAPGAFGEE
jgi:hypothetical protein